MGQEFHVLRCFSCQSFQVQQVKKVKKWLCKLCGQKQSLLKEFGRGSGADCRRHVQKLNAMRGTMLEEEHCTWASRVQVEEEDEEGEKEEQKEEVAEEPVSLGSRWSKYLSPAEEMEPESPQQEEEEEGSRATTHLCRSRKRRISEELPHHGGERDSQLIGATVRRSADEAHSHLSTSTLDCSLSSNSQNQKEEPPFCGRSQVPTKPRLGLVSSLFETDEDFTIDF